MDDYGIVYTITPSTWTQRPNARHHIAQWTPEARSLLAQNDAANPTDGVPSTRIDRTPPEGMAPYEWAFRLSVYDAPVPEAARVSGKVNPETPRTGCNGYPFSRMRRATHKDSTSAPTEYWPLAPEARASECIRETAFTEDV